MKVDLSELNPNSESETLELKESFAKDALETIGAFANAQGGIIIIGARDNGKIIGVTVGANTLEEWAQKIQAKIQPRTLPSIKIKEHEGRSIAVISVDRSHSPVSVEGRYFKRVGRTNQLMSNEEIAYRILASSNTSWDSQLEERAVVADLDQELIQRFIEDLNKQGRRPVSGSHSWQEVLEKFKIIDQGKPTRAAVLLFAKDARHFYPSAYVKAGRFKSAIDIVDDSTFEGPLFDQLEKATAWFRDRLSRKFVIDESVLSGNVRESGVSPSVQRESAWEYPMVTLREAIVNAICHRDYKADIATTIRLFDDHLEIWNAGTLPPYLTPADLFKKHDSYPHNRLIAEAFYNTGIIEQWGSGTLRMAEALRKQNLPAPSFDTSSTEIFKLALYHSQPQVQIPLELNARQNKALEYLRKNQSLTNIDYQQLCGISRATASRDLTDLVKKKFLSKRGKTGKGTWYILSWH